MRVKDLPERIETMFAFPITRETLLEQAGDLEIEAPDQVDSETLVSVLERCDDTQYDSPSDLYESVVGNLDDAYIGRKYYDDRGMNPIAVGSVSPGDTRDQSF